MYFSVHPALGVLAVGPRLVAGGWHGELIHGLGPSRALGQGRSRQPFSTHTRTAQRDPTSGRLLGGPHLSSSHLLSAGAAGGVLRTANRIRWELGLGRRLEQQEARQRLAF